MKTRTGFVSNSSSSSFILDNRIQEHAEFIKFYKKYLADAYTEFSIEHLTQEDVSNILEDREEWMEPADFEEFKKSLPPAPFAFQIDTPEGIMRVPEGAIDA